MLGFLLLQCLLGLAVDGSTGIGGGWGYCCEWMLDVRAWSGFVILGLWLGGACNLTVRPILFGPDSGDSTSKGDGSTSGDAAGKCTGHASPDADPGGALSQGLVVYYPCEQASGSALPDLSGNSRSATLVSSGTGGAAGYSFATGKVGKALYLNSASDAHVVLPTGLLANACEATIAAWVFLNNQSTWQRIWTFSPGGNVYMFLTTNNDTTGVVRTGITLTANNADQQSVDGPTELPTRVWTYVAVVLGPAGLALYVDGVQVAASSSVTLRPTDMGKTLYDYIGRSNFSWDPYFDGNIDEFRVYNRALSPAEIQALYSGS